MYSVNDAHGTTQNIITIETSKCSKPVNLALMYHEMCLKKIKIQLK